MGWRTVTFRIAAFTVALVVFLYVARNDYVYFWSVQPSVALVGLVVGAVARRRMEHERWIATAVFSAALCMVLWTFDHNGYVPPELWSPSRSAFPAVAPCTLTTMSVAAFALFRSKRSAAFAFGAALACSATLCGEAIVFVLVYVFARDVTLREEVDAYTHRTLVKAATGVIALSVSIELARDAFEPMAWTYNRPWEPDPLLLDLMWRWPRVVFDVVILIGAFAHARERPWGGQVLLNGAVMAYTFNVLAPWAIHHHMHCMPEPEHFHRIKGLMLAFATALSPSLSALVKYRPTEFVDEADEDSQVAG